MSSDVWGYELKLPVNVELARVGDEGGLPPILSPDRKVKTLHTAPGHGHGVFKLQTVAHRTTTTVQPSVCLKPKLSAPGLISGLDGEYHASAQHQPRLRLCPNAALAVPRAFPTPDAVPVHSLTIE